MLLAARRGGAFYAFSEDAGALARLRDFWPLVVAQYAPGLAFDHGLGSGSTAFAADADAREAQRKNRSQVRPDLPQAGPPVHRSQRTGRPAVRVRTFAGCQATLPGDRAVCISAQPRMLANRGFWPILRRGGVSEGRIAGTGQGKRRREDTGK